MQRKVTLQWDHEALFDLSEMLGHPIDVFEVFVVAFFFFVSEVDEQIGVSLMSQP